MVQRDPLDWSIALFLIDDNFVDVKSYRNF